MSCWVCDEDGECIYPFYGKRPGKGSGEHECFDPDHSNPGFGVYLYCPCCGADDGHGELIQVGLMIHTPQQNVPQEALQ